MRQAQGTNLCAYLSMYKQGTKNLLVYIHIEHAQASWSSEVLSRMAVRSRKLVNVSTLIVKSHIKYSHFSIGREDAQ